jgi:hypothetical protein
MKLLFRERMSVSMVENLDKFAQVLERLRLEMEELEALRAAADVLRSFREKSLDTRFD